MYYQDQAIVLKRIDFRDDDLLLTFYTKRHGKIMAQAKGAKKIKSKLAGHIEPMNLVEIEWVTGRGGEKLTGAQVIESQQKIKENYKKSLEGFYFLEIIDKATRPHYRDTKIFTFLKNVLNKLAITDEEKLSLVKLCFEAKILFLLGYNPINRKGLDNNLKNIIQQIINLPVDDVAHLLTSERSDAGQVIMNIDRNILNNLSIKVKKFLEEVVEEGIKSEKFLTCHFD